MATLSSLLQLAGLKPRHLQRMATFGKWLVSFSTRSKGQLPALIDHVCFLPKTAVRKFSERLIVGKKSGYWR